MEWQKLSEEYVKVGYKWVTKKQFKMPDGQESEFTTWYKTGTISAAVVALTKEGKVLVARQYRPGPEAFLYDLPGGNVEPGEDVAEAAARELFEETGYKSDQPLEAIGCNRGDAYTNNTNYYFLARDCYQAGEQQLDHDEFVEILQLEPSEVIKNATSGQMSDGVAVLCAYEQLKSL